MLSTPQKHRKPLSSWRRQNEMTVYVSLPSNDLTLWQGSDNKMLNKAELFVLAGHLNQPTSQEGIGD
jgi:hypothetical protein